MKASANWRREDTMRKARNWYFAEFNPESVADFSAAMFGEHSGHLRMVTTYWDLAAALVNNGPISMEMFNAANGKHIVRRESDGHELAGDHARELLQGEGRSKGGRQKLFSP